MPSVSNVGRQRASRTGAVPLPVWCSLCPRFFLWRRLNAPHSDDGTTPHTQKMGSCSFESVVAILIECFDNLFYSKQRFVRLLHLVMWAAVAIFMWPIHSVIVAKAVAYPGCQLSKHVASYLGMLSYADSATDHRGAWCWHSSHWHTRYGPGNVDLSFCCWLLKHAPGAVLYITYVPVGIAGTCATYRSVAGTFDT